MLPDPIDPQAHTADDDARAVSFSLAVPGARSVCLAIFFSDWSPEAARGSRLPWRGRSLRLPSLVKTLVRLREVAPALWSGEVSLRPGWCEYMFLVDGVWVLDPDAPEKSPDSDGDFSSARRIEPRAHRETLPTRPAPIAIRQPIDPVQESVA